MPKKEIIRRSGYVRDPKAAVRNPEKVIIIDEEVEDNVEKTIVKIRNIISKYPKEHKRPLDFFKLVLNNLDFGKTIENMLHVSFLIRDGRIKMTLGKVNLHCFMFTTFNYLPEILYIKNS